MKEENKKWLVGGAAVIIIMAIISYFLHEKQKREKDLAKANKKASDKEKENVVLREMVQDLTDEVSQMIENKDELPDAIKQQLKKLILEYQNVDKKIADELISVTVLVEAKEEVKAIMILAKIIENLLKRIYVETGKISNDNFAFMINHAKTEKLIGKDEFHFLNGVREIRNEEAHNIAVRKSKEIVNSSMIFACSLVFKLSTYI